MSGSTMVASNITQEIKRFISLLTESEVDFKYHLERVTYYDKELQDLVHAIELECSDKGKRNVIATRIRKNRIARREHKNIMEATQPLFEFLQSEKGRQTYNLLREAQGKTKKIEEYHSHRIYIQRASNPRDRVTEGAR